MSDRQLAPKLRQGITTDLLGQDGLSEAPIKAEDVDRWRTHLSGLNDDPALDWTWRDFGSYVARMAGAALNMATMVGHGTVRLHAMGMDNRPPSATELVAMQALVDDALTSGACGFSTGLIYSPCVYSETEELVALGQVVRATTRSWSITCVSRVAACWTAWRRFFVLPVKAAAPATSRTSRRVASKPGGSRARWSAAVEQARAAGLDITADQYPYTAGSTMLGALLPPWCHARGVDGLNAYLRDESIEPRIRDEIEHGRPDWESSIAASSWDAIMISGVKTEANRWTVGHRMPEIAARWGVDNYQAMVRLLLEEQHAVSHDPLYDGGR